MKAWNSHLLCLLFIPLLVLGANSTFAAQRPNVIIVMTDDQGYPELSAHGNPVLQTPHLDRLHEESVRFKDFHVAPMCTPTRGQLLTGLDAARNGAINVSSGRTLLRANLPTMADFFRDNGYRTGIFGKWHLGDNTPYRPEERAASVLSVFLIETWRPTGTVWAQNGKSPLAPRRSRKTEVTTMIRLSLVSRRGIEPRTY